MIKAAQTNSQSFVVLYEKYYASIFGYVYRRTMNTELTKDITSEVFLRAFINIGKFKWKGLPFSAWLYRIATNEMNMADRKKKYYPQSLDQLIIKESVEISNYALSESERTQMESQGELNKEFIALRKIMITLPVKYQEVISLRYFEGKTIKEIAQILGRKDGTIRSLLSRGLDKLKENL